MSEKIRHLFLAGGYPSFRGKIKYRGIFAHRSLKSLSDFLDSRVIKISAFIPFKKQNFNYKYDGIDVKQVSTIVIPNLKKNPYLTGFFFQYLSKDILKEMEWAQIYHIGSVYPIGIIAQNLKSKYNLSKPLVAEVIGSDALIYLSEINKNYKGWLKDYLAKFDLFICSSEYLKSVMNSFGIESQKLLVAYKGVDVVKFDINYPKILREDVRFLYLGGFYKRRIFYFNDLRIKGGDLLLKAWEIFEKKNPKAKLILGGVNVGCNRVKDFIKKLKYPEKIIVTKEGEIPPDEMHKVYNDADYLIVPSLSEGLPNVIIEAQACGLPVIATDAGGNREAIIDEVTGKLIKKGSIEEIIKGFEWGIENFKNYENLSKKAREHMKEKFSWEQFKKSFMEGIKTLIK